MATVTRRSHGRMSIDTCDPCDPTRLALTGGRVRRMRPYATRATVFMGRPVGLCRQLDELAERRAA
jgi:hypothetical protein